MIEKQSLRTREPYSETAYRAALQTLGLVASADRATIHRAYRDRAKKVHPDLFLDEEEKSRATESIKEINAAHAYAIQHWRGHQLAEQWGRTTPERAAEATTWQEWVFLPVTAVYTLTTIVIGAPILALGRLVGPERRNRWREGRGLGFVWRLWFLVGPHGATLALFATAEELAVRAWFGVSFLVMLSADIATLVTGDSHALRRPLSGALVKLP